MELNMTNPESLDFCEAVGILPERQKELSKSLDEMVWRLDSGPVKLYQVHHIFAEIASFCKSPEELIYCTVLHCGWHARRGRILAPGPINYGIIGLGIEMLFDRLRTDLDIKSRTILKMLQPSNEEEMIKAGARRGVQRLLDLKEFDLARDIMDKLTGFAF